MFNTLHFISYTYNVHLGTVHTLLHKRVHKYLLWWSMYITCTGQSKSFLFSFHFSHTRISCHFSLVHLPFFALSVWPVCIFSKHTLVFLSPSTRLFRSPYSIKNRKAKASPQKNERADTNLWNTFIYIRSNPRYYAQLCINVISVKNKLCCFRWLTVSSDTTTIVDDDGEWVNRDLFIVSKR